MLRDVPVKDRVANVNIEESELPFMKVLGCNGMLRQICLPSS